MPFLIVRRFGLQDYMAAYRAMRDFTERRTAETADEVWLLEHPPVYTLGQAGKREHVLDAGDIPVLHVDRGGQVTYHGPGQLVAYVLLDLARNRLTVRRVVNALEQSIVDLLHSEGVVGSRRPGAPGIYVWGKKLGALGLRIRRGCTYHGLAVNVDMNLAPFQCINPCGYENLELTQLADLGINMSVAQAGEYVVDRLLHELGYSECVVVDGNGIDPHDAVNRA